MITKGSYVRCKQSKKYGIVMTKPEGKLGFIRVMMTYGRLDAPMEFFEEILEPSPVMIDKVRESLWYNKDDVVTDDEPIAGVH